MKFGLVAFGNEESYGLLFVGGELLSLGQEIRFFDAEEEQVAQSAIAWKPDFILFSPMTAFYPKALEIAQTVRNSLPEVVTVVGGHHATSSPGIIQKDEVDVAVIGPVRGSIESILDGTRGTIRTEPTSPSDLPLPARKEYYRDIPRMAIRYRKVMLSMLGCPWNCSYCGSATEHLSGIFGSDPHKRYYLGRRPLTAIIDEARELLQYKTHEIEWVDDDVLCGSDIETWIPAFVEAWETNIGIPMYVSTASVSVLRVSDQVLTSLRRVANCVGMGIQAIRPESLKLFNRGWDNESKMQAAYDRLRTFGYAVNLQCIVGLPVDDPVEDALETIKAMQRIGPGSTCSCYPLMIYPGTAMERLCIEKGLPLSESCTGDTNTGIPAIAFPPETVRRLRNICKLATLFVKYNIDERWMRPLIDVDFDDETSHALSTVRYYECVTDRLKEKGEAVFDEIMSKTKLRY